MRVIGLVTLFAGSALAASAALLACGNGDDNGSPVPPAPDAAPDGTVKDGAPSPEAGTPAPEAGAADAGADGATSMAQLEHANLNMLASK